MPQNEIAKIPLAKIKDLCKHLFAEGFSSTMDDADIIQRIKAQQSLAQNEFMHILVNKEEHEKIKQILKNL